MMKSVFKRYMAVLALTVSAGSVTAQQMMADSSKRFEKKSFRTWSVGLNGGILTHYTIFNNYRNGDFFTAEAEWGYGGYIKKQILPTLGLQADFLAGEVYGRRSNYLPDNTVAQDKSSFRTHIDWSAALSANFLVANLSLNHKRNILTPYVTAGAGYMSSRANVSNTPGGTALGFDQNWFIPVGAGIKFGITKMLNLDFGYTVGFMKTNHFDGVRGDRDDRFAYGHGGIEIALGKKGSSQLQNYSPIADLRESAKAESAELRAKLAAADQQRMADQQQRLADQQQYARDMADDDGDGVANKFDKCAGTPAGTVADGSGCPIKFPSSTVIKEKVTERVIITEEDRRVVKDAIKDLQFDNGKSTIKESSDQALNKVAQLLVQKNFSLKLAGHTDNVGSSAANIRLSKDRAEAVKAYLVEQGANSSRIEATGYGAGQPIASNKTAEGRQQNRRVEFSLF